jgi:hypothetical protein
LKHRGAMVARGSSGQRLHRNAERVGRRGGRPSVRSRQAGAPEPSIRAAGSSPRARVYPTRSIVLAVPPSMINGTVLPNT